MESSVKERITKYCKFKKISKSEFCRRIGVSETYIGSIRKSIQPDKIKSIAVVFDDLNIEWLLTGEGVMLKSDAEKHSVDPPNVERLKEENEHLKKEVDLLRKLLDEKERIIGLLTNGKL